MRDTPLVSSFTSRILRLHRTEVSESQKIHAWNSADLQRTVETRLESSSVAEAVAVVQVVPIQQPNLKSSSARKTAEARLKALAEHCRAMVRGYDQVGIWNWSVVIVMWGVTADEGLMRSVAHRIQGDHEGAASVPPSIIGVSIARPGTNASEVVSASTRAVAQARWSAKRFLVYGADPVADHRIDDRSNIEVAVSTLHDRLEPESQNVSGRLVLCSRRRRRSDYFTHPGASMVDRLMVGINSVAGLLAEPNPGWENLYFELPLAVLRASNTTPRVVESVMEEMQRPERLNLMLTGAGGAEMFEVVQELLVPIRESGARVERVIDYDHRFRHGMQDATILRVSEDAAKDLLLRSNPAAVMADGPMQIAAAHDVEVLVEAGRSPKVVELARGAGARFISGGGASASSYVPLRSTDRAA